MKKDLIITFKIFQDILERQNPDLTLYFDYVPDNPNSCTLEELKKTAVKKMMKPVGEIRDIPDRIGRIYAYRVEENKLKELLKIKK